MDLTIFSATLYIFEQIEWALTFFFPVFQALTMFKLLRDLYQAWMQDDYRSLQNTGM